MKNQFIKTIFGISLAICTAYSALRSAYMTVVMPPIASVMERSAVSPEEYAAMPVPGEEDDTSDTERLQEEEGNNSNESEQGSGDEDYYVEPDWNEDSGDTDEYYDGADQEQEQSEEYYAGADQEQEQSGEYYAGADQEQEQSEEYYDRADQSQGNSDEYYTEPDQGVDQPEVTLADFLAGLRCGACGRNCSLLSPHCRNGMFKAQQAEQEYYDTYGG